MNFLVPEFGLATPEIFLLSMICIILITDLYLTEVNRSISYLLAQLSLLGTLLLTLSQFGGEVKTTFGGSFIHDPLADILKIFIYCVTAVVFLYSRDYLQARNIFKGEYYVLGLFGVLGMMIMVSAHSFITIYLGLELLSLSMYAMVAFNRDDAVSSEAAMKYFVLGAIASGMLLYGISMLYGVTGGLNFEQVSQGLSQTKDNDLVLALGLVFIVVGLAFKFGAVPFHMWLPDVYHGAPTSVTLYIGAAPKIAAFAMAIRLLADGMQALHSEWQQMLIVLAVLSLAIGNIVAIAQINIKRMLAYSTISHVGFLLLGLLAGTSEGYTAAMFYAITYSIMATGAFGMVLLLSRTGFEADELSDFKGLNDRNPWYAFLMLIFMFSMAGVPPTVGFFAKLWVIEAVLDIDMVWIAITAVSFSIIGAYYYIRIVKLMYFDKPEDTQPISTSIDTQVVLSTNGLLVLVLGLFPGSLMAVCSIALRM